MTSITETGHAKNVANFHLLITIVKSFDPLYKPSKAALQIPALEKLYTEATTTIAETINSKSFYNRKVNERKDAYSSLKPLATRIINALQTTDAAPQTIDDAKAFVRKLRGKKASSAPTATSESEIVAPKTKSAIQLSYTQQSQHLAGLIAVLKIEPSYRPNESDLKIEALETTLSNLADYNTAVAKANAHYQKTLIARNNILYNNPNSIIEIAKDIKSYAKSVFGAASPEFAQIKDIMLKYIKS